jgi:phospholipase C
MATDSEVSLTSNQRAELSSMAQSRTLPAGYVFRAKLILIPAERASFNTIIVIIFQENRTPDNLFQALGGPNRSLCPKPYDLLDFGFNSKGQKITLPPTTLGSTYDLGHGHGSFVGMCNLNTTTNQCRRDGADKTGCTPATNCPPNPQFQFVQASDIGPYLTMARQYGWANFMFQTNQGPSTPAHQFIFAGTSARSETDDINSTFVAENPSGLGCLAPLNSVYRLIDPQTAPKEFNLINNSLGTVCFSHPTMASLLGWRPVRADTQKNHRYYWPWIRNSFAIPG